MATTSTSIPVPAPRAVGRRTWIGLALVTALLIVGVAAGIQLSRGGPEPAVGPVDTRAYENTPVTGTGPGLIEVADASKAMQAYQNTMVTGTGPGLAEIADQSAAAKAYQGQVITGTGPDLAALAASGVIPRGSVVSRGSVSPGHHVLPGQQHADAPTPPAGDDQCVIVAGRPIC